MSLANTARMDALPAAVHQAREGGGDPAENMFGVGHFHRRWSPFPLNLLGRAVHFRALAVRACGQGLRRWQAVWHTNMMRAGKRASDRKTRGCLVRCLFCGLPEPKGKRRRALGVLFVTFLTHPVKPALLASRPWTRGLRGRASKASEGLGVFFFKKKVLKKKDSNRGTRIDTVYISRTGGVEGGGRGLPGSSLVNLYPYTAGLLFLFFFLLSKTAGSSPLRSTWQTKERDRTCAVTFTALGVACTKNSPAPVADARTGPPDLDPVGQATTPSPLSHGVEMPSRTQRSDYLERP
ncbi:hypothetical protein LX36DRAFT_301416 [Colletotrichum falcatum]|nr:hypothetical protein LX36DRAFT_301416 [Colletotrichum falcatum]